MSTREFLPGDTLTLGIGEEPHRVQSLHGSQLHLVAADGEPRTLQREFVECCLQEQARARRMVGKPSRRPHAERH